MKNIFINDGLYNTIKSDNYEVFEFKNADGQIKHIFSKRAIDTIINGEVFYDLIPPAGFGGPVIINCIPEQKWDLVYEFTEAFQAYCLENNIVCEEVAFNSPLTSAVDFIDCYELECVGDYYGMDLTKPLDQIAKEDLSRLGNAIESGLKYQVIEGKAAVREFKKFAHRTDKEMYASLNQYIDRAIEYDMRNYFVIKLSFEHQVIAMSFSQVQETTICTLASVKASRIHFFFEMEKLLKCALYLWSKEKGFQKVWSSKDETQSKMAFETLVTTFCKGQKIWNDQVYDKLCYLADIDKRIQVFPAYRSQAAK